MLKLAIDRGASADYFICAVCNEPCNSASRCTTKLRVPNKKFEGWASAIVHQRGVGIFDKFLIYC
jgi:hypothetical protein